MVRRVAILFLVLGCGTSDLVKTDGGNDSNTGDGGMGVEPSCAMTLETPAAACMGAAMCPVVAAARGPCLGGFYLSIASGSGSRVFVGFTTNIGKFRPRIWTIDPPTASLENDPIGPEMFSALADPNGAPSLIGAGDHGRAGPLVFFPGKPSAWSGETITLDFAHWFTAAYAPDGTFEALFSGDNLPVTLAKRTAPNTWTKSTVTALFEGDFAIAVDAMNKTHVVYFERRQDMSARDLKYAVDGSAPVAFFKQPFGSYGNEHTQLALGTSPIVLVDAPTDGTHLLVPNAMPVVDVQVPEMGPVVPKSCRLGGATMPACDPTCSETADGASSHALATTDDGSVWIAYVHRHVQRDYTVERQCGGTCQCVATLVSDKSTAELVIAKANAMGTVDVRWRAPLVNADSIQVVLSARGTRLNVAIAGPASTGSEIRFLAIDAMKL